MRIKRANFSLLELIGYPKECGLLGSFFWSIDMAGKETVGVRGGRRTGVCPDPHPVYCLTRINAMSKCISIYVQATLNHTLQAGIFALTVSLFLINKQHEPLVNNGATYGSEIIRRA